MVGLRCLAAVNAVTNVGEIPMTRKIAKLTLAIVALAFIGSLQAHHSISMFDLQRSVWLKGTVVKYEPVNPHAMLTLEQKGEDGQVQRWIVEGPNLARLQRMGVGKDFLKTGDAIEVCGFPFKERFALTSSANMGDASRPALHAHMLVMPDGHMRLFGPYGKLDNCIRPHDTSQSWVDFLNADPLARQAWCVRNFATTPSTAPKALVDEINRLIANPCD
jgi:hypothetical protein